jgi:hypothetical protein
MSDDPNRPGEGRDNPDADPDEAYEPGGEDEPPPGERDDD